MNLLRQQSGFSLTNCRLNSKKTKYTFFHRNREKDNIPLILPKLQINQNPIMKQESTKFLGICIDENLTWQHHINLIETKISKNLGLLYKAKQFLNKKSLLSLYYSYIHTYIKYGSLACGATNRTNLKKINSRQKHAIGLLFNKNRYTSARPLMKSFKILK